MAQPAQELPVIFFETAAEWEAWLEENHATQPGVWVKYAKKASGITSMTYVEAVEVALCFGWIDGQAKGYDDDYSLQRYTPRRPKSKWSKINCQRALRLIEGGRMRPAGLAQVEAAKADGRWDAAYDSPSTATVPPELQTLLDGHPEAAEFFASLDSRNRYAILHRIQDAKRPETRARRIEKFFQMLVNKEKIYG